MKNPANRKVAEDDLIHHRAGSNVLRVNAHRRVVHFASVNPMSSSTAPEEPITHLVFRQVAVWLAWRHLQQPDNGGSILPEISERLQHCDIDFTLDLLDTQLSQIHAAKELSQLMGAVPEDASTASSSGFQIRTKQIRPAALIGAGRSSTSITLSTLSSAFDLPQVSPTSTSTDLESKEMHPLFARTVPTNHGDAQALMRYLAVELQVPEIAIIYIADGFGISFHADLAEQARIQGIAASSSFAFYDDDQSLVTAMEQLQASGRRYIVAVYNSKSWKRALQAAVDAQIMGVPGYTWLFTEFATLLDPSFGLDRSTEAHLAQALHGTGVFMLDPQPHAAFGYALDLFYQSPSEQREFREHVDNDALMHDFVFPKPESPASHYLYTTYDAVVALAIAACETPQDLFTGSELYQQLLQTQFEGVSGHVAFDNVTGTRLSKDFQYRLANVVLSEARSTETELRFTTETAATISLGNHQNHSVQVVRSFQYADSSETPPDALPPLEQDLNLIPRSALIAGWCLSGLVLLLSLLWLVWIARKRKHTVVRASQPIFLVQLCVGTAIAGSCIIPMSLQEPVRQFGLNIACMAVPWLLCLGFVTTISALLAKTWRLNQLLGDGPTLKRVKVLPRDVILPFIILLAINILILSLWSALAPLTWHRLPVTNNVDSFGRPKESYGMCTSENDSTTSFLIPLVLVNALAFFMAAYQSYKAHNISTQYSESNYIFIAMFSLLETVLIGIPLLLLLGDDPTSFFLVRAVLVSISTLAIQLPIFLPKFIRLGDVEIHYSDGNMSVGGESRATGRVHISMTDQATGAKLTTSLTKASLRTMLKAERSQDSNLLFSSEMDGGGSALSFRLGETRIQRSAEYYSQREVDTMRDMTILTPTQMEESMRSVVSGVAAAAVPAFEDSMRSVVSLVNAGATGSLHFLQAGLEAASSAAIGASGKAEDAAFSGHDSCTSLSNAVERGFSRAHNDNVDDNKSIFLLDPFAVEESTEACDEAVTFKEFPPVRRETAGTPD